jgi:hypothetical protein
LLAQHEPSFPRQGPLRCLRRLPSRRKTCRVQEPARRSSMRRLESHWYSVWFYTDEVWGLRNRLNCTGLGE